MAPSSPHLKFDGINRHFLKILEDLWIDVLGMAAVVETTLRTSLHAFVDRDTALAAEVKVKEPDIDRIGVRIEQECIQILALYQPVATDLRRVTAAFKIAGQLERMADLGAHIAKRVKKLQGMTVPASLAQSLEELGLASLAQVRLSLDALANKDAANARLVLERDREIDRQCRSIIRATKDEVRRDPEQIDTWLRLINTAKNFERWSDHATNIAENVIYMEEGAIVTRPPREKRESEATPNAAEPDPRP